MSSKSPFELVQTVSITSVKIMIANNQVVIVGLIGNGIKFVNKSPVPPLNDAHRDAYARGW